jgi:hypothetical protein
MKILVAHSRYSGSQPSGENIVVDAQVAVLRTRFDVVTYTSQTPTRPTLSNRLIAAHSMMTNGSNSDITESPTWFTYIMSCQIWVWGG